MTRLDAELLLPARPCPLCDRRDKATLLRDGVGRDAAVGDPRALQCRGCGLVFLDPVPAEAYETGAYGSDYYAPWQGREEKARRRLWARRLEALERHGAHGTLLDVGCGDGLFLEVAQRRGWRCDGIEFSPEGARRAAARLRRPIAVGDLAMRALHPGPYDVVTLWHVLEHLPEPRPMLEAARRRLRPGGTLVVAVPNTDNLPMRAAYRVARGRPLPLWEPGAREPHVSHFTPATLREILSRAGFEILAVEPDRCALTPAKRLIDAAAAILSSLGGTLLTDAIAAFARRPA
ncbi:MAG TPA: class I SAM-dependent methyltransferase [Verrucomicrobiae bacterium]|nr:class I SAM-dependent methyltransferase [Verrucomicrobiae bacterium]